VSDRALPPRTAELCDFVRAFTTMQNRGAYARAYT